MNDLEIFKNEEFGEIRTVMKDGEPMFCLADICKVLDLEQVSRVKQRLKADGVTTSKVIDRLGGNKAFSDIWNQLKREFGCVSTYKSIKRRYIADVHEFIDCYEPPRVLAEQITDANAQLRLCV